MITLTDFWIVIYIAVLTTLFLISQMITDLTVKRLERRILKLEAIEASREWDKTYGSESEDV